MAKSEPGSATQVQYHCPTCGMDFVCYHRDDYRRKDCEWCKGAVTLTGKVSTIEGDDIVHYEHGKEVGRELRKDLKRREET